MQKILFGSFGIIILALITALFIQIQDIKTDISQNKYIPQLSEAKKVKKTKPVIATFDNKDYIIAQEKIFDNECEICEESFTNITQSPNKKFIAYIHSGYEWDSVKIYDIKTKKTHKTNSGDYKWLEDGRLEIHGNCFFDNCGYYYSKSPTKPWETEVLKDTAVYEKNGSIFYRNEQYTYAIARAYNDPNNELEAYNHNKPSLSPSKKLILFYKQGYEGPAEPIVYPVPDTPGYESREISLIWENNSNECFINIGTSYEATWLPNDKIKLIQKDPDCGPYITKDGSSPWELERK